MEILQIEDLKMKIEDGGVHCMLTLFYNEDRSLLSLCSFILCIINAHT